MKKTRWVGSASFMSSQSFSQKNKKKSCLKKFLIFREMKISNHKSKKLVKSQTKNLQSPKNKQKIYSQEISCLSSRFCNLYSSKAQPNFLWSKFKHYMTILMFKEYKRFRYFIKYSYAQEMELSSSKIKKLIIFQEETYWTWKSNKKSVPK